MVRTAFLAILAFLIFGGIARAEERTMHFDNLVLKYDFPSRFAYAGRDDDHVYFSDGDAVIEFGWRYLGEVPDDIGAALLEKIEDYPTSGRVDGYFRDDLEFEIGDKDKFDRSAFVRWWDNERGYTRLSYAMIACCDSFVVFTIEHPRSQEHNWLEAFYASFNKGEVAQYDSSNDRIDEIYRMKLPRAETPATNDAQRVYDACSYAWNKHLFGAQPNAKALVGYIKDGKGVCESTWNHKTPTAPTSGLIKSCEEKETGDCYLFAKGDHLSKWADDQRVAVEYGNRDGKYRRQQQDAREAAEAKERRRTQLVVRIDNKDRFDIGVAFYSDTRKNFGWPGNDRHWVMDAGEKREFTLSCQPGEKICYGAARKNNDRQIWGVGLGWIDGCQQCCMTCGGDYGYNLADGGPYRAPQVSQRSGGNTGVQILGSVLEGLAIGLGAGATIQNSSPPTHRQTTRQPGNWRPSDISGTK